MTTQLSPPAPVAGSDLDLWMLDPEHCYLNHGSFGARLREVCAAQQALQKKFESRPIEMLERQRTPALDRARSAVGAFVGLGMEDLGFVTNATEGVNAVLRSLTFEPGDEILTTDHVYHAVRQTLRYLSRRAGATLREVPIPLPVRSPDAVVDAITNALTERTRLLVVDHVTSPTAIRFPVERLIELCAAHGIDVLVDGAHAPGMLDLNLGELGAAYYAGNLHKWVGAPMGTAFLHVRADRRAAIHPAVISHYLDEGFGSEFDWQGTRDLSAWLSAPIAITAVGRLGGAGGWDAVRGHNHQLATWAGQYLCDRLETEAISPADGSMLGSIVSVEIPASVRATFAGADELHRALVYQAGIEVPVFEWNDRWLVRPSAQVYNSAEQYEKLANAILELRP